MLGHDRHLLVSSGSDGRLAVDQRFARRRRLEAGDHPQQRRLAAPGRADDADERPLGDLEIDVGDGFEGSERLAQPPQRDGTRHGR